MGLSRGGGEIKLEKEKPEPTTPRAGTRYRNKDNFYYIEQMEIIIYIAVPVGAYARIGNIVPLVTLVPHKLKIESPKIKIQNQNQKTKLKQNQNPNTKSK